MLTCMKGAPQEALSRGYRWRDVIHMHTATFVIRIYGCKWRQGVKVASVTHVHVVGVQRRNGHRLAGCGRCYRCCAFPPPVCSGPAHVFRQPPHDRAPMADAKLSNWSEHIFLICSVSHSVCLLGAMRTHRLRPCKCTEQNFDLFRFDNLHGLTPGLCHQPHRASSKKE